MPPGVTMLSIAIGHQMDAFTYLLGDFSSVSATATTLYKTGALVDASGNITDKTVAVTGWDQVAFTGLLKSGGVSSVTWRSGLSSTKGRKQFIWEIDGEEGSIRLEDEAPGSAFIQIRDPKLYLDGELVKVQNATSPANILTTAWAEYAKGEKGTYATIEDAVKNHRLLDAIIRSVNEGKTIKLD